MSFNGPLPQTGKGGGTGVANTGLTITLSGGSTGYVLTSDSSGNATWAANPGSTGFNNIVMQVFTGSGTYTPTASMVYCIIEVIGGGGGGGGAAMSNNTCGSGGGAGEYARGRFTATDIGVSQSVTIGAGGGGGTGTGNGSGGGTTSVGSLITAAGGSGGLYSDTYEHTAENIIVLGGAGGTGGSGGSFRSAGANGGFAQFCFNLASNVAVLGGAGGNSQYGSGGNFVVAFTGATAKSGASPAGYGAGGGGAASFSNASNQTGATGAAGIVIVTEYID